MARVLMTTAYSDLVDWPGRLFEADDTTVVTTSTSTVFTFELGADSDFTGFDVTFTGTGFTYNGTTPTGGKITKVEVRNDTGTLILTIDQFSGNGVPNDLSQIVSDIFGSEAGPRPDGKLAWSHLLLGNDTVIGTAGNDETLKGFMDGNDTFVMKGGSDSVYTGAGRDTVFGGAGYDEITFEDTALNQGYSAFRGIRVNMNTGKLTDSWGFVDTFKGIESIRGSRFNDVFIGSEARDEFVGFRGRDVINGGADLDRVRYDNDHRNGGQLGIIVDLETSFVNGKVIGQIRDGFGQMDKVINIERVIGTRYDDVFVGSRAENEFYGGEGVDSFDGQGGVDSIRFSRQFTDAVQTGVNVDLSLLVGQIINDGFGNTENAVRIEDVTGSANADTISGNAGKNFIQGAGGADVLAGKGGADYFYWDGDDQIGEGDVITDFAVSGVGQRDTLAFNVDDFEGMTATLRFVNGAAATIAQGQFFFDAAVETLYWDSDGTGSNLAVAVVELDGVTSLTAANFNLFA